MKIKYILIVSVILAIIAIGAVSASDDADDNLTADSEDSLFSDDESLLSDELNSDEWNDKYPDDEYPISEWDDEKFNYDDQKVAQVKLNTSAEGRIAVSVNGSDSLNKSLDEFDNRYHPQTYDWDTDSYVEDESKWQYDIILGDLDYTFQSYNYYLIKVSYFDGADTYTSSFNVYLDDNWNIKYPDDSFPIDIYWEDIPINDENEYFADVTLNTDAIGRVIIRVNGSEVYNESIENLNGTHPYTWDDDDNEVLDESRWEYRFYLKDLTYEFEVGKTYLFTVSYFDGEDTYSESKDKTIYKKDIVSKDGISVEILSHGKVYLDDYPIFIEIYNPANATADVTVVISGNGKNYNKKVALSDIDTENGYDEENKLYYWYVYPKDLDIDDLEVGTYEVKVTYEQEGIDALSVEGNVTFTTEYEDMYPYKGYINSDDINMDDGETTLVSVYCPEGTTGKFVIKVLDNDYEELNTIEYVLEEDDYGKTITWNMSALGIEDAGKYYVNIYYYSDDEYDDEYVASGTLNIFNESEFRVKDNTYVYLSFDEVFFVFSPAGSAGTIITLNVTDASDETVYKTYDYTVTSVDEGVYKGFTFDNLGISEDGEYIIHVLIGGEEFGDYSLYAGNWDIWFSSVDVTYSFERIIYIILSPETTEGTITLKIGDKVYFKKALSEFDEDNIDEYYNDAVAYEIYYSDLETLDLGTYNMEVIFEGNKTLSSSQEVTLYKRSIAEDDETGIEIILDSYDSRFVFVTIPDDNQKIGNITIAVDGKQFVNIDLETFNDYAHYEHHYADSDGDISAYYYWFYTSNDEFSDVVGSGLVKVSYILNGEEFLSAEATVKFNDRKYSELTFDVKKLIVTNGTVANITFNVTGAEVETENIVVENSSDAVVELNGNTISISGLAVGNYTVKVTTTPTDDQYAEVTESVLIVVKEEGVTYDPNLAVEVANVEEGTPITVIVSADESFSDVVIVKIEDYEILVNVVYGSGSNATDIVLPVNDSYIASLNFTGNDDFNATYAETTFNVTAKVNPTLEVTADNIYAGQNATINISMDEDINATVTVNGVNVTVKNGKGTYTVQGLAVGSYNYTVNFSGNAKYNSASQNVTFNVLAKVNTTVSVTADDVYYGQDVTVNISMDEGINDTVTVNGENVTVKNGKGTYTVQGLAVGSYNYTVNFSGNAKYNSASQNVTFNVLNKVNTTVNATADDVYYGQDVTVNIVTDEDVTGTIVINGENVTVTAGKATYTFKNLAAGNYTYEIELKDDVKYNDASATVSFKVMEKLSPNMTVTAANIVYGAKAVVKVTADTAISGNVTVQIDGKNYTVSLVNGSGSISVASLAAGTHTVKAVFEGSTVFNAQTANTTFKVTDKIKLTLKKVKVKKSAKKLKLKATLKINGKAVKGKKLKFKFNKKTYTAKTSKKGVAKVTIKKKVLKKLKKGKKVTYQVSYGKTTVKKTVKVKK